MLLHILGQVLLKLTRLAQLLLALARIISHSVLLSLNKTSCICIFLYLAVMVVNAPRFALVNKNMPAVAGGLRWAQELQQRIQTPFAKFRHLSYPWVCFPRSQLGRLWIEFTMVIHLDDNCSSCFKYLMNRCFFFFLDRCPPGRIRIKSFARLLNCALLRRCLDTPEATRVMQKYEVIMQRLDRCVRILSQPIRAYVYVFQNLERTDHRPFLNRLFVFVDFMTVGKQPLAE